MKTVTESIFNGKSVIVPFADVQHIETHNPLGLIIVTKHTRWDKEGDFWANSIWIDAAEAPGFKSAWCRYRSELEADTLAEFTPSAAGSTTLSKTDSVSEALARWYRAHHHGLREDEALQSDLLAKAYGDFLDTQEAHS